MNGKFGQKEEKLNKWKRTKWNRKKKYYALGIMDDISTAFIWWVFFIFSLSPNENDQKIGNTKKKRNVERASKNKRFL